MAGALRVRGAELGFQVAEVGVDVTEAPGLTQTDTVDDAGVVQRVGDDGVLRAEQGFKQPAVGVEARGVENRVLRAEELAEGALQLLVDGLRAADEAHAGQAEAVAVQRFLGRGDKFRMVSEAEVIVGAEVQDRAAVRRPGHGDGGSLGASEDAFGFVEAGLADGVEGGGELSVEVGEHPEQ